MELPWVKASGVKAVKAIAAPQNGSAPPTLRPFSPLVAPAAAMRAKAIMATVPKKVAAEMTVETVAVIVAVAAHLSGPGGSILLDF